MDYKRHKEAFSNTAKECKQNLLTIGAMLTVFTVGCLGFFIMLLIPFILIGLFFGTDNAFLAYSVFICWVIIYYFILEPLYKIYTKHLF